MTAQTPVFISGNFNVLHAGHIRLFAFACNFGPRLIVGVVSDRLAGDSAYINENLRLEAVKTNSWVSEAILIDEPIDQVLRRIRPDVVVKGREFENQDNIESLVITTWGGRLIFGSSELPLSSIDMMRRELAPAAPAIFSLPQAYMARHKISRESLAEVVRSFVGLKVCVVGDLIVDEYISCESLGMSREDPSLVVTPLDKKRFLGGAGIVAAHASGLGADSALITVTGDDECSRFAGAKLSAFEVTSSPILDDSRPTTLKQRFRSEGKTLLRVSHLVQSSISPSLQEQIYQQFLNRLENCDLVVFSDFNYGCLPSNLVEKCVNEATSRGIICVADSQCSSQVGDVSRFQNMALIAATEREVRISLRDNDDGLTVIADRLKRLARATNVMVKLGADGVLLHMEDDSHRTVTNQLPALNPYPVDVAGAGDSMLIAAGLALAAHASPWEAAALGAIAAAMQVGKLGNNPIQRTDYIQVLENLAPGGSC